MKNSNIILAAGAAILLAFGGVFLFFSQNSVVTNVVPPTAHISKEENPPKQPGDVALFLIDALGDGRTIKPATITANCLSEEADQIANQFDMLLSRIQNSPGSTEYHSGVYVTLMPDDQRPIYQLRLPNRTYCKAFEDAFQKCSASASSDIDLADAGAGVGDCIKEVAKGLNVREDWSGYVERYSPEARSR